MRLERGSRARPLGRTPPRVQAQRWRESRLALQTEDGGGGAERLVLQVKRDADPQRDSWGFRGAPEPAGLETEPRE